MTDKDKKTWSERDVQQWFKKLDRFNAVEPFVFEREPLDPPERGVFEEPETRKNRE